MILKDNTGKDVVEVLVLETTSQIKRAMRNGIILNKLIYNF